MRLKIASIYKLHFFSALFTTVATSVSNSPKINAHRKPSILMPDTNLSASRMMMTFTTRRKSPRVMIVSGRVKMISSGFTMIFNRASTKEKMIAVSNDARETCGSNSFENPYTATAMMRILIIHFMLVI